MATRKITGASGKTYSVSTDLSESAAQAYVKRLDAKAAGSSSSPTASTSVAPKATTTPKTTSSIATPTSSNNRPTSDEVRAAAAAREAELAARRGTVATPASSVTTPAPTSTSPAYSTPEAPRGSDRKLNYGALRNQRYSDFAARNILGLGPDDPLPANEPVVEKTAAEVLYEQDIAQRDALRKARVTDSTSGAPPNRDNFQAGEKGDQQYQKSVEVFNAKEKADNGNLPSSILDVESTAEGDVFLDKIQNQLFDSFGDSDVTTRSNGDSALDVAENFLNTLLNPESPSSESSVPEFSAENKIQELRDKYDVEPIEDEISGLDEQIREIEDIMEENRGTEEGKAVQLGVIQGRISEEERQANTRLRELTRRKGYLVDQLNSKYTTINTMMSAASTDYQNAKEAYNTKFSQSLQIMNAMLNVDQAQKSDEARARDDARANVTIVTSALQNGTLEWDNLDPKTKAQYTKLELQAGLPTGTIQSFSAKENANWEMSTVLPGVDSDGNAIATIIQKNKLTGEFQTTKLVTDYAPKGSNGGGEVTQQGTYVDSNNNQVAWQKFADGTIETNVVGAARTTTASMSPEEKFENDFNKYVADLIYNMNKTDQWGGTIGIPVDAAAKQLLARYPELENLDKAKMFLTQ